MLVEIEMNDFLEGFDLRGIANEEGGEFLFADFDEVCCIGGVVSADDEQNIHFCFKHFKERVLAFLGGTADGIENEKVIRCAITIGDGLGEAVLDFLGLAFEHGGLVSNTDSAKMEIWVEVHGVGALEVR